MSQPSLITIPFAQNAVSGTINVIPNTRPSGGLPQSAAWNDGFPLVTMTPLAAGGIPPQGQDLNGVLNAISLHTVFVGHGGQYKWSSTYVAASGGYSIGDVIQSNDGLNAYVSLVNSNTIDFNANPGSIGTSWGLYAGRNTQTQATEAVPGISQVATQTQTNAGAIDTAMVTPKKHASSVQSGAYLFSTDTGTANTYVCAFVPAITARTEGQVLRFKVNIANTGASTINDGLGAVALVGGAHSALQGGELVASGDAWVQWNTSVGGGSYILLFCTGAAEQIAPATRSQHAIQLGQSRTFAYAPDTGTTNTYVAAYSPVISSLTAGMQLSFLAKNTNTGGSTFSPNGITPATLYGPNGGTLLAGEILAGVIYSVAYVASGAGYWLLLGPSKGRLLNIQTFTANGTYTPTPGAINARYMLQGGGAGGGAGANGFTNTTSQWLGGGGGAGGSGGPWKEFWGSAVSAAVTVGAGGAGGTPATTLGGSGQPGGSTSVAGIGNTGGVSVGGTGGGGSTTLASCFPGAAAVVSQGGGGPGTNGSFTSVSPGDQSVSGNGGTGGASFFGTGASGGSGGRTGGGAVGAAGQTATVPGGGGGGGGGGWLGSGSGFLGGAGGAGANGQVVIYEYA